jgi:DNA-binding NtrC family response regulator
MPTSQKLSLLLVDDDSELTELISAYFKKLDYEVHVFNGVRETLLRSASIQPDVAIIDCLLADGDGIDLISNLQSNNRIPILILTGHASIDLAVRATKQGAEQFLTKPIDLKFLASQVSKAVENQRAHRQHIAYVANHARWQRNPFLGCSCAIRQMELEVQKIVGSDLPILIEGETGTGKGVLAEWLHNNGPRSGEAMVSVNCAGLSKELLESELFGHEKGSFTGAVSSKQGLLETAHRGTAFLDEIGDMDLAIQPKLLKVVEEQNFRRVGGVRDHLVNIRLIAATHRDLMQMVRDAAFRSDLYFRINTITIRIPNLRSRPEDIPLLAQFFVERLRHDLGRPNLDLSKTAWNALKNYHWPGNIREVRNVLERAALIAGNAVIETHHLLLRHDNFLTSQPAQDIWHLSLEKLEAMHIEQVLNRTQWSVGEAARRLGIAKSTLYAKLRYYNLSSRHVS